MGLDSDELASQNELAKKIGLVKDFENKFYSHFDSLLNEFMIPYFLFGRNYPFPEYTIRTVEECEKGKENLEKILVYDEVEDVITSKLLPRTKSSDEKKPLTSWNVPKDVDVGGLGSSRIVNEIFLYNLKKDDCFKYLEDPEYEFEKVESTKKRNYSEEISFFQDLFSKIDQDVELFEASREYIAEAVPVGKISELRNIYWGLRNFVRYMGNNMQNFSVDFVEKNRPVFDSILFLSYYFCDDFSAETYESLVARGYKKEREDCYIDLLEHHVDDLREYGKCPFEYDAFRGILSCLSGEDYRNFSLDGIGSQRDGMKR